MYVSIWITNSHAYDSAQLQIIQK